MHHSVAAGESAALHPKPRPDETDRMRNSPSSLVPWPHRIHDGALLATEIPALRQALARQPASPSRWLRLGLACVDAGDHAGAIEAFNNSLRLDPANEQAHASLARALSGAGRFIDAAQACYDGLAIHPHGALLRQALSISLGRIGLITRADDIARDTGHPADSGRLSVVMPPAALPDAARAAHWRRHLAQWQGIKIGLAWNDASADAPERSLPLTAFAALAGIPGLTFFSLHPGREALHPPEGLDWVPLAESLNSPAELAAALAGLDAVITVDAGIAAQAATTACHTWLLLPEHADWSGDAQVRVLRQARRGDGEPALREAARALLALLEDETAQVRLNPQQHALLQAHIAMARHRYTDAEQIYRALLDDPASLTPPALFALRRYVAQTGRHVLLKLLERCRNRVPDEVMSWLDDWQAMVLMQRGEREAAFRLWERLCAQRLPALPPLLRYAAALQQAGSLDRAIEVHGRALDCYPDAPELLLAAAQAFRDKNETGRAADCLRRALAVSPHHAEAHLKLGILLREQERIEEARDRLQASLRIDPRNTAAWDELGYLLHSKEGRHRAASVCFRRSLESQPAHYACTQLGYCHYNLGEYEEAVDMLEQALRLSPDDKRAFYFRAVALHESGRHEEAISAYQKLLAENPDDRHVIWALSWLYLITEDFARGWAFMYRYNTRCTLPKPEWKGESLAAKTLLVRQHHGFGDMIQFVRALPLIKAKKITLAVKPPLLRLFRTAVPGADEVLSEAEVDFNTLDYDYHTNEVDLMRLLDDVGTTRSPIPVPYLKADSDLETLWRQRIRADGNFKIGIAWAGNTSHYAGGDRRTTRMTDWLPLADLPNVSLYSLQKDESSRWLFDAPQLRIIDPSGEIQDFSDTAALMASLDLIITVDSSPAHLAGALGRPVWTLLPTRNDWRWLRGRSDSPWYPSMRLFRQKHGQTWGEVLLHVKNELVKLLSDPKRSKERNNSLGACLPLAADQGNHADANGTLPQIGTASRKHYKAVHQFSYGCWPGDGVGNALFFTQRLLRSLGFESEIYCVKMHDSLRNRVHEFGEYPSNEDQILLLHHAYTQFHEQWIFEQAAPKILVYHNITPASFYPEGSDSHRYCIQGRKQLASWTSLCLGAIGDSEFNSDELRSLGYGNATTIPMLVDIERIMNAPWRMDIPERHAETFNVLFVGRVCEHKCQHDVIDVFSEFLKLSDRPARLILVGWENSGDYRAMLDNKIAGYGMTDCVEFTGGVSDDELYGYYRCADAFVCMSMHEGFCMPLVEAMVFDVPVLAYNSSNVANTLGGSGLLFNDKNPRKVAAELERLASDPVFCRKTIEGQRRNLKRFGFDVLRRQLANYLHELGINLPQPLEIQADIRAIEHRH